MKHSPAAIDTLLIVLNEVRNSPDCKYHTLDIESEGFMNTFDDVPAAHELLKILRCKKQRNVLKLDKSRKDLALIYMAICSLESATTSNEYLKAKNSTEEDVRDITFDDFI